MNNRFVLATSELVCNCKRNDILPCKRALNCIIDIQVDQSWIRSLSRYDRTVICTEHADDVENHGKSKDRKEKKRKERERERR